MTPELDYSGKLVVVRGYNGVLATSNEFLSSGSVAWTDAQGYWSTATAIEVISGAAGDAAEGTGMRTVRVVGADSSYRVQTEDFTLNGTTLVAGSKLFTAIYAAYGLTYGSGLANAGLISARKNGTTALITIPVGENIGQGCVWVCPTGGKYRVKKIQANILSQPVIARVLIRDVVSGAWYSMADLPMGSGGYAECNDLSKCVLSAGDAIRIDALSTTAAGRMFGAMLLERIDGV